MHSIKRFFASLFGKTRKRRVHKKRRSTRRRIMRGGWGGIDTTL